jgi:hypothetical protein
LANLVPWSGRLLLGSKLLLLLLELLSCGLLLRLLLLLLRLLLLLLLLRLGSRPRCKDQLQLRRGDGDLPDRLLLPLLLLPWIKSLLLLLLLLLLLSLKLLLLNGLVYVEVVGATLLGFQDLKDNKYTKFQIIGR